MFRYQKDALIRSIVVGTAVLAAYICRFLSNASEPLSYLRSLIYVLLFIAWAISVHRRVIQVHTKSYLVSIAGLMIFWVVIRTIKYNVVKDPYWSHWCWYLYYIPLIFAPLFALYASQSICSGEDFRVRKSMKLLYIPAGLLLLLVLSNDLHQQVFLFSPDGPMYSESGYHYGGVYYMIVLWIVVCFAMFVVSVFMKSRMVDRKRRILLPIGILVVLAVYSVLYIIGNEVFLFLFGDLPVVYCLLLIAFFDCLFMLNLIQSNTHYLSLFRRSSVPAVIVDENNVEQIRTAAYTQIPDKTIKKAIDEPIVLENGIRLSAAPIKSGHVLWQEDISDIVRLNEELESTRVEIEEQNAAELEAYKAEYLRHQLEEKNRLYDKLQQQTRDKVRELSDLLDRFELSDGAQAERLLLKISVIGAYIKRRCNLSFLSEDWRQFPAGELKHCIEQSLDCLSLFGIETGYDFRIRDDMLLDNTIKLYEVLEEAIECSLDSLSELFVTATETDADVLMVIRLCADENMTALSMPGLTSCHEDGEWCLSYRVRKEDASNEQTIPSGKC